MDKLTYKQLQKLAKEHGIPANLKKANMILLLTAAMVEEAPQDTPIVDMTDEESSPTLIIDMTEDTVTEEQQEKEVEAVIRVDSEDVIDSETVEEKVFKDEVNTEKEVMEEKETGEQGVGNITDQTLCAYANMLHELVHGESPTSVPSPHNEPIVMEESDKKESTKMDLSAEMEQSSEIEPSTEITQETNNLTPELELEDEAQEEGRNSMEEDESPPVLTAKQTLMQNLGQLPFKDLQKVAKSLGIPANLKRSTILNAIVEQQLSAQATVVVMEEDNEMDVEEVDTSTAETEKVCVVQTPAKQEIVVEEATPDIHEVSTREIDMIFDVQDDEDAEYEDNQEDYDEDWVGDEEDCDESVGKKLFCTPAKNTKIIFSSPTPTKSGTKPYEKYNVTWTYDDYENKDPQQAHGTPVGVWSEDDVDSEDPSTRVGEKMKGMATPKGTKTTFMSPQKSAEKSYYQYNVHWSYEQYLAAVDN